MHVDLVEAERAARGRDRVAEEAALRLERMGLDEDPMDKRGCPRLGDERHEAEREQRQDHRIPGGASATPSGEVRRGHEPGGADDGEDREQLQSRQAEVEVDVVHAGKRLRMLPKSDRERLELNAPRDEEQGKAQQQCYVHACRAWKLEWPPGRRASEQVHHQREHHCRCDQTEEERHEPLVKGQREDEEPDVPVMDRVGDPEAPAVQP